MSVELVKRVSAVTSVVILVTEEFAQTLPSEWVDPDAAPEEAAEAESEEAAEAESEEAAEAESEEAAEAESEEAVTVESSDEAVEVPAPAPKRTHAKKRG